MMKVSLLLLVALFAVSSVVGRDFEDDLEDELHTGRQSYRVKGTLKCGNRAAAGAHVKLFDMDKEKKNKEEHEDQMGHQYSDDDGKFDILGDTHEMPQIEPWIKISHNCDDGTKFCERMWTMKLPAKYISHGSKTNHRKTLDIGHWNLEARLPDEENDCISK